MLDDTVGNDYFKYNDYYYSTGRTDYPIAASIEDALKMPLPKVPDLSCLQNNLLERVFLLIYGNNEKAVFIFILHNGITPLQPFTKKTHKRRKAK